MGTTGKLKGVVVTCLEKGEGKKNKEGEEEKTNGRPASALVFSFMGELPSEEATKKRL